MVLAFTGLIVTFIVIIFTKLSRMVPYNYALLLVFTVSKIYLIVIVTS